MTSMPRQLQGMMILSLTPTCVKRDGVPGVFWALVLSSGRESCWQLLENLLAEHFGLELPFVAFRENSFLASLGKRLLKESGSAHRPGIPPRQLCQLPSPHACQFELGC